MYFAGGNSVGDFLITGMARRHNKLVDGFLLIRVDRSTLGILESMEMPSTELYQQEDEEGHSAGAIKIEHAANVGKWKISYQGKKVPSEYC